MIIKVIRELDVPAGSTPMRWLPKYKAIYDERDQIAKPYIDHSYTATTENVVTDANTISTVTSFYKSLEGFDECMEKMRVFMEANALRLAPDDLPSAQNVKRRYQIRDAVTDLVIRDWTNF
jgi:hypothetical protein